MKTEIVAEIGSNWEGNLAKAKKIILECKKIGVNAVKFQMWRAEDLYSKNHPNWKIIKKSELTFAKAKKINEFAKKTKIEFFCSVFYPEAVDFLELLQVKRYKVASRTCLLNDPHSFETLLAIAKTKKPVIVSMGMGGNIKQIKKIFTRNQVTFCYCISEYPLPIEKIKWKEALRYSGFSDHTLETVAPILFTILKKQKGAKRIIIEKHTKLKNSQGPDASSSIDASKLASMISNIRIFEKIIFN